MSKFLKCDAPGCNHRETVPEITADMIGKPCQKCGASLLTEGDWQVYVRLIHPAMDAMVAAGIARLVEPGTDGAFTVNYHDGQTIITIPTRPVETSR